MSKLLNILIIALIIFNQSLFAQELILDLDFDNNLADQSGYSNHPQANNVSNFDMDRHGNLCGALKFENQYFLEIPHSSSLSSIKNEFTIAFWAKIDEDLNENKWLTIICKGNNPIESKNNPQYRFQIFQSNSQSTLSVNTEFTEYINDFSSFPLVENIWNFYALTYDGKFLRYFINSKEVWSFAYNGVFLNNTSPLYIGYDIPGAAEYFNGTLDDLKVYNYSLSHQEILSTFNYQKSIQTTYLSCPNDTVLQIENNTCGAQYDYEVLLPKLSCSKYSLDLIEGKRSGSLFHVDNQKVKWLMKSNYREAICEFNVQVIDDIKPLVECPKDEILYTTDKLIYEVPDIKAIDICGIKSIDFNFGYGIDHKELSIGDYLVRVEVIDSNRNTSSCYYNVNVREKKLKVKDVKFEKKDTVEKGNFHLGNDVVSNVGKYTVESDFVTIVIYDPQEEDGDVISVIYNNNLVLNGVQLMLKENDINVLKLPVYKKGANFIVKAWNEGRITPNTVKVEIFEGELNINKKDLKYYSSKYAFKLDSKPGEATSVILKSK